MKREFNSIFFPYKEIAQIWSYDYVNTSGRRAFQSSYPDVVYRLNAAPDGAARYLQIDGQDGFITDIKQYDVN